MKFSAENSKLSNSKLSTQRGFTLIALLMLMTVFSIMLLAAERTWVSVMKQEREAELIFRGEQYAGAILDYQTKMGSLPADLEQLLKSKPRFIRQLYPDPMAPDGEWYIIRAGDPILAKIAGAMGAAGAPAPDSILTLPPGLGEKEADPRLMPAPERTGPIVGVVSRRIEKSYKRYNGREFYNEWFFTADEMKKIRQFQYMAIMSALGVHQVVGAAPVSHPLLPFPQPPTSPQPQPQN